MTQIKNLSAASLPFVVGGTPDNPTVEFLKPGETKNLAIKEDSPILVGLAHAGSIAVGKDAKSTPAPAAGETAKS